MASVVPRARIASAARRSRDPERVRGNAETDHPVPFAPEVIVERFARMLQAQERSPCTVKQYTHIARIFFRAVPKPLEEVTARDLEAFREHLVLQRHYSKNSLYTTIRGLTCLFRTFQLTIADQLEPPTSARAAPSLP